MGQYFKAAIYTGYGAYQLNDVKDLQLNFLKATSPLKTEAVDKFPDYYNYTASLEYCFNTTNYTGLNTSFYTTGARNHLKDYSGEYKLDMILDGFSIGLQYRHVLSESDKINLYFLLKSGIIFSTLKINESLIVNGVSSNSNYYTFGSKTFFGEPDLGAFYPLGDRFAIDLSFGYQFNLKSKLYLDNKDNAMYNPSGSEVKLDWSGLRITLGLSFNFDANNEASAY